MTVNEPTEQPACPAPAARRNIRLVVAYHGAAYHGWQRQAEGIDTVQQRLEEALVRVVRHPVIVFGAGRTDAGVHALGQSANFYTTNFAIPLEGLRKATNARLPRDIAVLSAAEAPEAFHASRSAVGKTYRYRVCVAPTRPVERHRMVYHYPWHALDAARMRAAAVRLLGTHDFRGFASSLDPRENSVRTIFACDVAETGDEIHVTVQGSGFLYNMVRNLVGTLLEVGRGHWPAERIDRVLASRDRADAGPTAPPDGLYMVCVHYGPDALAVAPPP
ncbi:MAG TPA: tRNA pseudouridine(38-40) synthase TruA [Phycisphaerales bacterium]|nr:tRNA pseudouridine(38-40) synthase TruA [Phycisphaerales bacterium]